MSETVREPHQQRAIDKKKRIIEAGYKLFACQGYFSTNTVDIAKEAGVSTGIVYGYFHDKRDILLEVLDIYISKAFQPIFDMIDAMESPLDFATLLPNIVDETVEIHKTNAAIHETLHSLSSTDKVVNDRFLALEGTMTMTIVTKLNSLGYTKEDLPERVHLAFETTQSYAHEVIYDKHSYIKYPVMRELVIKMLMTLFL